MSNALPTPDVFAKAGLLLLTNNLVISNSVSTQYTKEFRQVGQTVRAKRHPEFQVGSGRVAQVQDVLEGEVTVNLNQQKHVAFKFTSVEETLTMDSLVKSKSLNAAMAQLAQKVDSTVHGIGYRGFYSWAGTAGQTINSATDFFKGPERLTNMAVPMADRHGILYPTDAYSLAGSFTGGASTSIPTGIAESAIRRAQIPMIADVSPMMSQSVLKHTNGAWAGTPLVKGASQTVLYSTEAVRTTYQQGLLIDGLSNATTIKVGDVFTLDGVYAVNPRTKEQLDYLQQFVVRPGTNGSGGYASATETQPDGSSVTLDWDGTYTFSTSGSSEMTIQISPPIIITGAHKTVSAAPANDAPITLVGSGSTGYVQNLVYHREAIALCTADMITPRTGSAAMVSDPDTGISIRYWQWSDGINDEHFHRFDILFGVTCLDPRLGTRLSGTA